MGWQRAFALLACISFLLFSSASRDVQGTTHYVAKAGSSTPPYTSWATAAWFVESASEMCSAGDTIMISAGDYDVSAPIYLKDRVVVIGQGRDSTWLHGYEELYCVLREPGDSVVIRNIGFYGNSANRVILSSGPTGPPPYPQKSLFVENCYFTQCRFDFILLFQGRELTVRDCEFSGYGVRAITIDGGGGSYATGTYTIENCIFFSLSFPSAAIEFRDVAGPRVIRNCEFYPTYLVAINDANCFKSMHVENCRFMTSGAEFTSISSNADSLNLVNNSFYHFDRFTDEPSALVHVYRPYLRYCNLSNNIFQSHLDNAAHALPAFISFWGTNTPLFPETMVTIRNNCIWANRPFGLDMLYSVEAGNLEIDSLSDNIIADPMYVAPPPEIPLRWDAPHDVRLQFGSPGIDAGVPWVLDVDGSRSDLGAFGGPNGHSYTYLDLPPRQPAAFAGVITVNSVVLRWLTNTESDLSHYALYRGTYSGFPLDHEHRIASISHVPDSLPGNPETDSMFYAYEDTTVTLHTSYFYVLVAVDDQNNTSETSPELAFIVTDADEDIAIPLPTQPELMQNYPNPFNAETKISYFIPGSGTHPVRVIVTISNVLGQEVCRLVDAEQAPGHHNIIWNGRANSGTEVASGLYFYTLHIPDLGRRIVKKVVLMK